MFFLKSSGVVMEETSELLPQTFKLKKMKKCKKIIFFDDFKLLLIIKF